MTARQILSTATEWMFRTASVRAARAGVVSLGTRRERALGQARLLLEVANRVKFPVERLPKGRRPAVLVGLYRDAITCALAAQRPGDDPPPQDLRALWADCAPGELARAAGGTAALDAASRVLFEIPPSRALDVSAQDAAAAGALAKGLVGDLDAARNRLDRLIAQRWLRILLVVGVLLAIGVGVRRLVRGPDLASNATLRVSSSLDRVRQRSALHRAAVSYRSRAQSVGGAGPGRAEDDPPDRDHQPDRLLQRTRRAPDRRVQHGPRELDAGGSARHGVPDLDADLQTAASPAT